MAVLETIRNFFVPSATAEPEICLPAPGTVYQIRPLTNEQLADVLRLNIRCFQNGDSYTKYTFEYLLNEPRTLSYRVINLLLSGLHRNTAAGASLVTLLGTSKELSQFAMS
jgi:hypothetical protein